MASPTGYSRQVLEGIARLVDVDGTGFIDDVGLMAVGKNTNENCKKRSTSSPPQTQTQIYMRAHGDAYESK